MKFSQTNTENLNNGTIYSSNINEGIKVVFILKEKTPHAQKAQNVNKRFSLKCFYPHKKHKKHKT